MKRLFIQLSTAIFIVSAFSFHCLGQNRYTLEYRLERGKTYKQRSVTDMDMTMELMGQRMSLDTKMEMNLHYDVVGLQNDVYDIRVSYQRVKMSMTSPTPFSIDSDSPESASDRNLGNALKSLTEIPIDIQLTKAGRVVSVKGADKLAEKFNTIANEQMRQMLGQQFSESAMQAAFERTSAFFPDRPVTIGESWNIAYDFNAGGIDIVSQLELTLKQVSNNIAVLECKGTLKTLDAGATINIQGMDAKVSVNGEQSGTIRLDSTTGWINRMELTQKFVQNIEIMGQTMPQEIVSRTVITPE